MGPLQASVCNHVKNKSAHVGGCLGLIFFSFVLLERWETVFREVCWLCQTVLVFLKPEWMEVRLSANQNVSLMVFRDEVYSDTPSITAAP